MQTGASCTVDLKLIYGKCRINSYDRGRQPRLNCPDFTELDSYTDCKESIANCQLGLSRGMFTKV